MALAVLKLGGRENKKIEKFNVNCRECGSDDIEFEIDWAAYPSASWNKLTIICKRCHSDETVYDSND